MPPLTSKRKEGSARAIIGAFDSGVGGLSVLRAIRNVLPEQSIYYVADSAHCPYGSRPPHEIRRLSTGISRFLLAQGAKAIVVACNTASAAALAHLRSTFPDTPFVGMVPAVKPAASLTKTGTVGVLATPNTLQGGLYHDALDHFAQGVRVIASPCHGLVDAIELGAFASQRTVALLQRCLDPLLEESADVIVLGCTHYPLLTETIRSIVGPEVQVIDPSEAIARQTHRVLAAHNLLDRGMKANYTFGSTGSLGLLCRVVKQVLHVEGQFSRLEWQDGVLRIGGQVAPSNGAPTPNGLSLT